MPLIPLNQIASINGAFSKDLPGHQLVFDSISYSALQTCPYYYYLTIIQGLQPRRRSVHLVFGIAWHSALERFHLLRAKGHSYESALLWTIAETYYRQLRTPVEWAIYFNGYHEESIPQYEKKAPAKTPRTLCRALIAYLDHYEGEREKSKGEREKSKGEREKSKGEREKSKGEREKSKGEREKSKGEREKSKGEREKSKGPKKQFHTLILSNNKPAVELSFRIPIPNTPYSWAGHLDRVVSEGQPIKLGSYPLPSPAPHIFDTDYKTTTTPLNKKYWDQFSPDNQMTGYAIGSKVALPISAQGVYVDATQLLATGQNFAIKFIPHSNSQIDEFLKSFVSDMKEAKRYAQEQVWPLRYKSCRGPYGDCAFRQICIRPPEFRLPWLEAGFEQKIWDPTKER